VLLSSFEELAASCMVQSSDPHEGCDGDAKCPSYMYGKRSMLPQEAAQCSGRARDYTIIHRPFALGATISSRL
jgi:hypothetical protein